MINRETEHWASSGDATEPPEAAAEFAACREDVLEVDETPPGANCPVIAMDARPVQLLKEPAHRFPPRQHTPNGSITNTNGRGPPVFSCSPNRGPAGAK